jgi:hypothetical protein
VIVVNHTEGGVKGSPKPVEYTRAGWRVNPWADAVGISRSQVYEFIKAGMVRTVKIGGSRIIVTPPDQFLAEQAKAA